MESGLPSVRAGGGWRGPLGIAAWAVVWVCVWCFSGKPAHAAEGKVQQTPVRVTAQRLEVDDLSKTVTFIGKVRAVQGDLEIRCSRMKVFYTKRIEKQRTGAIEILRIEAEGNVTVSQGNRIVRGEKAEYDRRKERIEITGNPVFRQGLQSVRGDRIVFFPRKNRFVVEGSSGTPVKAVLFPSEMR